MLYSSYSFFSVSGTKGELIIKNTIAESTYSIILCKNSDKYMAFIFIYILEQTDSEILLAWSCKHSIQSDIYLHTWSTALLLHLFHELLPGQSWCSLNLCPSLLHFLSNGPHESHFSNLKLTALVVSLKPPANREERTKLISAEIQNMTVDARSQHGFYSRPQRTLAGSEAVVMSALWLIHRNKAENWKCVYLMFF